MLKQVTELSAQLVEADRLIDEVRKVSIDSYISDDMAIRHIACLVAEYRRKNPSTVPDENWNVLEQEEKETLER
jgi:hypothetical protein